jgi:hypothetical protein
MTHPSGAEELAVAGQDTGVLLHGRDLHAPDLLPMRMLWGLEIGQERRLGMLPTTALAILDAPPGRVRILTIGSGASVLEVGNGETELEAEVIKSTMVEGFDRLEEFDLIRDHPNWQDPVARQRLHDIVADAETDTEAENTTDEIANAAALFERLNVTRAIQVTSSSHGPRCLIERNHARELKMIVPRSQRWSMVTDDEPFALAFLSDPLVIEPPHRSDDPKLAWPESLWPTELMRDFYKLPPNAQLLFAHCARGFIEQALESGNLDWFRRDRQIFEGGLASKPQTD